MRSRGYGLPAAALLCWAAGAWAGASYRAPFPPPSEMRAPLDGAGGDMLALALGARRAFADLWFVRLMQYYGTHEFAELDAGHEGHDHEPGGHCHVNRKFGAGRYPEFLDYARHILFERFPRLDIPRPEKFGGPLSFASYKELEEAYAKGQRTSGRRQRWRALPRDR